MDGAIQAGQRAAAEVAERLLQSEQCHSDMNSEHCVGFVEEQPVRQTRARTKQQQQQQQQQQQHVNTADVRLFCDNVRFDHLRYLDRRFREDRNYRTKWRVYLKIIFIIMLIMIVWLL